MRQVYIYSDSQAALKATCSTEITLLVLEWAAVVENKPSYSAMARNLTHAVTKKTNHICAKTIVWGEYEQEMGKYSKL